MITASLAAPYYSSYTVPAPVFVNTSTAKLDAVGTSIAVSPPASVQVGDLLIAVLSVRNVDDVTTAVGWEPANLDLKNGTTQRLYIYSKKYTSADAGGWTFSWTSSNKAAVLVYAARYVNGFFLNPTTIETTTSNHTAPAISQIPKQHLLLQFLADTFTTFTEDASMTERGFVTTTAGDAVSVFIADQPVIDGGDSGTRTITSAVGLSFSFTGLLALFNADVDEFSAAARIFLNTVNPASEDDHDVLASAIRAEARLVKSGGGSLANLYALVDRLWATKYNNGTIDGFGLTTTFDAFGDTSTNPADTIYSITTAWCGLAFLDAYQVTGNANHLTYAQTCGTSLASSDLWNSASGWSWYSDQVVDQVDPDYEVYNVSAQACLLWSRLGTEAAKVSAQKTRLEGVQNVDDSFPYSPINSSTDIHHNSYIVEFLLDQNSSAATDWLNAHTALFYNNYEAGASYRPSKGPGRGIYILNGQPSFYNDMLLRAREYTGTLDASGYRSGFVSTKKEAGVLAFGLATLAAERAGKEWVFH